ncbi:MAG: cell division protein SepF [Clostridia bacterium]|nr:cell division protein SepF [Clostridia bacterium]
MALSIKDGIRNGFGKIQRLWSDDVSIEEDVEVIGGTSEVVTSEEPKDTITMEPVDKSAPATRDTLIYNGRNRKTEQTSSDPKESAPSIYAHENDYTGDRGYDDNSNVSFSVSKNTGFKVRPARTMPAAASASSTVVSDVRRDTQPVKGYSFSAANEPTSFGITPTIRFDAEIPTSVKPQKSVTDNDAGHVRAKAAVGFNTTAAMSSQQSASFSGTTRTNTTIGGKAMDNKTTLQILKPTNISEASEASALLKRGVIVVAVLSGITDKNARVRYSDFLCGCCKGCDADFCEIVPVDATDAVLMAIPGNVTLVQPVREQKEKAVEEPINSDLKMDTQINNMFMGVDITGERPTTNWYNKRF